MSDNNKFADAVRAQAPARGTTRRPGPASRAGMKHVGAYVPPETARALRVLAASEDTSVQKLIVEAIEHLLSSRGQ